MANLNWNYTERAKHYDRRADYSLEALKAVYGAMGLKEGDLVADLGAGTGKLTIPLFQLGLKVFPVEPNDAMRSFGISNTSNFNVSWGAGTGENTGLDSATFKAVFFGSSFNVVNQELALKEVSRILVAKGHMACMWNHRDLSDPTQAKIEAIIKSIIANYDYGTRRADPSEAILKSGLFGGVSKVEVPFSVMMTTDEIVDAWKSHETLARQAGPRFGEVITAIEKLLSGKSEYSVPYHTRIWWAQKR